MIFADYILREMKADGLENVHGENVQVRLRYTSIQMYSFSPQHSDVFFLSSVFRSVLPFLKYQTCKCHRFSNLRDLDIIGSLSDIFLQ